MKLPLLLLSALALAAPASAASLAADFQAPVTIALDLKSASEVKSTPITGGNKLTNAFVTVRVSARDFLEQLIEEGKIVGPIKGWRIVARCTSDDAPVLGHRLYAVKAGQPDYAFDTAETPVIDFTQPQILSAIAIRSINERILVDSTDTRNFTVVGNFLAPIASIPLSGVGEANLVYRAFSLQKTSATIPVPSRIGLALNGGLAIGAKTYVVTGDITFGVHRVTGLRIVASD